MRLAPVHLLCCSAKEAAQMTTVEWVLVIICAVVAVRLVLRAANAWRGSLGVRALPQGKWSGEWKSDVYPLISGRLFAVFPDPVPRDEDFEVDVVIYYNLWCLYRPGQTIRSRFVGRINADNTGGGGNEEAPIRVPVKMVFKSLP